ncbi:unnamed protein product [Schistosoma rodhaini]|nr:unnamed protein product [Schistosoma rodhaini]CAH8613492.1 unnamed protein product [Schistosoma rodhaini]CAH8613507.1 unnamed protein product [Schistosoma rodhaini]
MTASSPKIEVMKFDGSPLKFWTFIKGFKANIADRVEGDTQKLMYLIHYCEGAAKDAIEHCVLLPEGEGYTKAINILHNQFGKPHDIVEAFLTELLNGVPLNQDDISGLQKLTRLMTNCKIALTQMGRNADLNCSTNLKRIVRRLPRSIQFKWAEAVDDILRRGLEPNFDDLLQFLGKKVSIATNTYGQLASGSYKAQTTSNNRSAPTRAKIHTSSSKGKVHCVICSGTHEVVSCPQLLAVSHNERLELLRKFKLCFSCLKPNHRAKDFRQPVLCEIDGCKRRHHRILHNTEPDAKQTCCNSTYSAGTYLGFVPVRLHGPTGHVDTYALLDNGSDSTLLLSDVAKQVGISGTVTRLSISSVIGASSQNAELINFEIESLDKTNRIKIEGAYAINNLPIKRAEIPPMDFQERWKHLKGVQLPTITCDKVGLLLGVDVPEAHWVIDQRIGKPKQPYATLTMLGWALFGPTGQLDKTSAFINCLEAKGSVEEDILKLVEHEFSENKYSDKVAMSLCDKTIMEITDKQTVLLDGHYQVSMPWKVDWNSLPRSRCSFIINKSRIAPLKFISVSRLELQVSVLAVKLMRQIVEEIKLKYVTEIYFWTDFIIVLNCILNTASCFKYVASSINPADLASRGMCKYDPNPVKAWPSGPEFLTTEKDKWPEYRREEILKLPVKLELKNATTLDTMTTVFPLDKFISHFSSWIKLKQGTAWLIRSKRYLYNKTIVRGPLTLNELDNAEGDLLKYLQEQEFAEIRQWIKRHEQSDNIPSKNHVINKLRPIVIDNLIRVGGRLNRSDLPVEQKHPIILPSKHPITELIIRHYHQADGHMGVYYTLAALRKKFWILKGTTAIKRIIHKCIGCRIRSARPMSQLMGDLPPTRITPDFPFATTGVDYFGPITIKEGRKPRKCYGCLFTCFNTRAVHIEVACALSIDSFLMALSRFSNRRGAPKKIYSDRGTTFAGLEKEIQLLLPDFKDNRVAKEMIRRNIEWHYNIPYASHRGGIWERLIRSIRRILSAVSGEQTMTYETLTTYLTEVERILNDRPLVPVYDDPEQLETLSPNNLLLLRKPSLHQIEISLRERYSRQWLQAQLLATTFWRRWIKEYLPLLQTRAKWTQGRRDLRVGDLVLIIGDTYTRNNWLKGLVVSINPGEDGLVRQAKIRTSRGIIIRDIRKICLLEGADN